MGGILRDTGSNTARTVGRQCANGRRNNHAETSKASALRPVMQRVYPRVGVRHAMRRKPDGTRQRDALRLLRGSNAYFLGVIAGRKEAMQEGGESDG